MCYVIMHLFFMAINIKLVWSFSQVKFFKLLVNLMYKLGFFYIVSCVGVKISKVFLEREVI